MGGSKLPASWCIARVDELGDLIRGVSYKKPDASNTPREHYSPLLRSNNINGTINHDDLIYVCNDCVSPDQYLQKRDILIAMSSGSKNLVGKAAQAQTANGDTFGAFCGVLRPARTLDARLLGWFFQTRQYREGVSSDSKGSNINNLKRDHILQVEFPLPPLNEQRRIVEKIETLFAELDKGEEALREAQHLLALYRQSVLKAAVTGELTDSAADDWTKVSLDQLLEDIRYGTSKKCGYNSDGVGVLRIPNVVGGRINLDDLKFAQLDSKEFDRLRLKAGDLLVIRSNGSASLVGRSAVVSKKAEDLAFAGYLIRLRVDTEKLLPDFLQIVLESPILRAKIEREARSTSGVHNINSGEIRAIELYIPPVDVQTEIVDQARSLLSEADVLERLYVTELTRSAALRQSILKEAFAGRMVPQDPNDEPASELLARIRDERDAAHETAKKAKAAAKTKPKKTRKAAAKKSAKSGKAAVKKKQPKKARKKTAKNSAKRKAA